MNSWRWRTGFIYLILGVILFGASALFWGNQEKRDKLPTGTEVIGQGIEEKEQKALSSSEGENLKEHQEQEKREEKEVALRPLTEEERMKSELALVGIKTIESPSQRVHPRFPSPVQGTPIKEPGNYYSESLQAYLFHAGTDYAQTEGAVIRVKHSGKVIYAGPDPILGQKVEIDCGDDWSIIYGGLENLRVKEGDSVEINQALGQVGYYPDAEGVKGQPQLHFEVWHGDEVQVPNSR